MTAAAEQNGPVGVALLNMGGPATVGEIRPFLTRLFSDAQMLPLPTPFRQVLARFIAWRRAPKVSERYEAIGGGSPVGRETVSQVKALQQRLGRRFIVRHVFRYADPGPEEVLSQLKDLGVQRLVALPAYPQWSVTTSGSSFEHLLQAARLRGVECLGAASYPAGEGFIRSLVRGIEPLLEGADYLLFTAHGLPLRVIQRGDPYVEQVERTVEALTAGLGAALPMSLAYQSRLGPVEWVGPHIDDEIRRLGGEGVRTLVVAPVTFTCENLETLWDLDRDMAELGRSCGIETWRRAPAPGTSEELIEQLARLTTDRAVGAGWLDGKFMTEEH